MINNVKLKNGQFLKIEKIYAFIAKDSDGNEGVLGFGTPKALMPMIGADLDRVESLRPVADIISKRYGIEYEIRYFSIQTS